MIELHAVIDIIAKADVLSTMSGFDPDKTFKENGIDSLDVMTLFLAVEERYRIKFSESEVEEINTASELMEALNTREISA
jgi:acyl carrier protein